MTTDNGNGEAAETPREQTLLQKIKGWFTRAKESETAEKAGEFAGKAWDKTKDASAKAWDKTKDVAGEVKDKVDEKLDERREATAEDDDGDDD